MTITDSVLADALGIGERPADQERFPFMPFGTPCDMGHAADGTPLIDPAVFDSAEFRRNAYAYYRLMRDHYPVFHDKLHNCYWVTRYEDIERCYMDEAGFNTIPKGSSSGVLGNTQLELSGVEHRRRRNIYGRHLVGGALTKRIPALERIAAEMVEEWTAPGSTLAERDPETGRCTIEFGRAFANEFPIRVVGQILGFPDEARDQFFYWYSSMMNGLGGSPTQADGLKARQDLEDYVTGLVAARRREPTYLYDAAGEPVGLDIISELCQSEIDGSRMSTEEITSFVSLIVGGGGETTRGALMNMWYLLLCHPDQMAAVKADETLWDKAFQEALRCAMPIAGVQPRNNSFDVEIHGMTIPAGSMLQMVDYSANHDDRIFRDPDSFDIHRDDLYAGRILRGGYRSVGLNSHLAFGVGTHLCPGAWISTQEAVIGSRIAARAMGNPTLVVERQAKDIDGVSLPKLGLGSPAEIWISFDPVQSS